MMLNKIIKHYWIVILTALVFSFWLGFFITENICNQNLTYYSIEVNSSEIEVEDVDADFFLNALVKKDGSYSYESVKPKAFFNSNDVKIKKGNNAVIFTVKAKYFIGSEENTISIKSLERFEKVLKKVTIFHDPEATLNDVEVIDYQEPYTIGLFSLAGGFILLSILFVCLRKKLVFPSYNALTAEEKSH